jgi:hypothetical protein
VARWGLQCDGRRIYMTDHAVERYRERVRPHLETDGDVYLDAKRLVDCAGEMSDTAPEWVRYEWVGEHMEPRGWLVCGDIAMPVTEDRERPGKLVALTVLTRGSISDESRRERNRRRSARTHGKRRRAQMERKLMPGYSRAPAVELGD